MKKKLPFYVTININTFEVGLFATKTAVAKAIGCDRTTITHTVGRTTISNFIVIPLSPKK